MGFTRSTIDISVHQKLGDYPNQDDGLSAEELKKRYDYPAETLQNDLNKLEKELEDENSASQLGASSLDENDKSDKNIQSKLNKIYDEFKSVRDGEVKDASLVTSKIQDGAITNAKVQDGAINTNKIADASITTNKIADSNVTTNKIADGAITGEKVDVNVKKAINITAEKMNENDISESNVQSKLNKLYNDIIGISQGSVADNSIITPKIVDGAITNEKLATNSISNEKIKDNTITENKLFTGYGLVPKGLICMWSGSTVPTGWYLCNGTNGTPDLRNRFIVGSGDEYSVGATGGSKTVTLTEAQIPAHQHSVGGEKEEAGKNDYVSTYGTGGYIAYNSTSGSTTVTTEIGYRWNTDSTDTNNADWYVATTPTGSGQAHENRPPYYALAFIMKA